MPIPSSGSLSTLMDNLVALEQQVKAEPGCNKIRVYRWQPNVPELPALWNALGPSPLEQKDSSTWRDTIQILVRLGIALTDTDEQMAKLERYTDAVRDVIDTHLAQPGANLGVRLVKRTGMRPLPMVFNEIRVQGFEFLLQCELDRNLRS